jgi:hypothetical protein
VITPKDEDGSVSFELPPGITARIEVYQAMNGTMIAMKLATIPRVNTLDNEIPCHLNADAPLLSLSHAGAP